MNKRIITTGLFSLIALTGSLQAQEDHLIENQRYVVGINDFAWGDTYVGKYTSDNALILTNWIEGATTNDITLSVQSLQIGSESNFNNTVYIGIGGELQIGSSFTVLGTNNGNGLLIDNQGTLFVESDFDAAMGGFYYLSGANLKVGGEVSNLDSVEDGLNFTLTGENATWNFGTNVLTIGAITDSNSVSLSSQASLDIDNIILGAAGTTSNRLAVTDRAKMTVRDSIDILGTGNTVDISSNGILAVYFDFSPITNLNISDGGILEAHNNLNYTGGIEDGGGIIMTGTSASWTNLSGSLLQVGADSEDSFLYITNGATVRAGTIEVGSPTNFNNDILITDGGNLIIENTGSIVHGTNSLNITQGGKLTLLSDYDYGLNEGDFHWYDGGIIEAHAEAPIFGSFTINDEFTEYGILFLNYGKVLILNGPSARWSGGFYNLHIGDLTANNNLIITNGGRAFANSVSVGDFKEGGNNNSILITGTNSALYSTTYAAIGGTIDNGNWYEGGISNSITVANGGLLSVGSTLHNQNTTGTSGLHIKPGGIVEAQDYYQSAGAYLMVYTDATGTNSGLLRVIDTAEFEAGANVGFDAVAALSIGTTYTNMIVESGTLIVGGVTNATTDDLSVLENIGGSLVNYDLWETNQNIYASFTRRAISDGGGITDDLLMLISDEIDRLAGLGNAAASNQVAILSGLSSAQINQNMKQTYLYQLPTYMHNQGVFGGIDQVKARGAAYRGETLPAGAKGPGTHDANQGLQGWAKVYGSYGNRDEGKTFNDGYDAQSFGSVIGMDQAFNDWLFGVAGGYAGTTIDGDNGDESDASTGYGLLYASYGSEEWFGDVVVSYGLSDIDNTSGGAFDVKSSTEASQTAFYIGGGKEYKDPEGTDALLRPLLALQISQYDQDGYTEKSSNAVAKDVDGFDRWSYQSIVGAELMVPVHGKKLYLETEYRAYWLHEFNDDAENVDYTLAGTSQRGVFTMRAPHNDVAQLGIGCVARIKDGLQLRADLDTQLSSDFFSSTLSGAILYEF